MTDTVIIYGHSDDLIEIEGALNRELPANYDDPTTIEFSDGRRFTVDYDTEGIWRIVCENPDELSTIDYSDIAIYAPENLTVFNDYSEKVVYRSWNGVDGVEVDS